MIITSFQDVPEKGQVGYYLVRKAKITVAVFFDVERKITVS